MNIPATSLSRMAANTSGRTAPPSVIEIGRERGGAGRVVRGVEQQLAAVGQPARFEPSRPLRIGEPGGDAMSRDANAVRVEHLRAAGPRPPRSPL